MPMLKSLKEKAVGVGKEGLGRAKAYREEQVRHRGEVRDVREKVTRSELEQEAAPIAKKYGISLEEAIIWLQSEKKKQQRAATVERMGTWGDDLGKGTEIKKHKKETLKQHERRLRREYEERNGDIEEYHEFLGGRVEKPRRIPRKKTAKRTSTMYDEPEGRYPEQREGAGIEGIFFKPQQERQKISKRRKRPEEDIDTGKSLMSAFIPGGR